MIEHRFEVARLGGTGGRNLAQSVPDGSSFNKSPHPIPLLLVTLSLYLYTQQMLVLARALLLGQVLHFTREAVVARVAGGPDLREALKKRQSVTASPGNDVEILNFVSTSL